MTGLKISPDLELPLDAVTWTFAFLAMRRAGKSTAVVDMAEEMTKAGLHWIAIDPKGDWWGIRSSADGQRPGLSVPIFGGLHGDVALTPSGGALVAELLVREGISALVDISELTKNEQTLFLGGHGKEDGFFARLYRLKGVDQPPTHVFLEEADEYLPQSVSGAIAKLHNDGQRVFTKGGQRGLGGSLVTQRPARLHNDVLTQTDNLVAMRNTAPTERKQIRLWTDHHNQSKEIVDSLPSLADGEAWFVSPHRMGFVGRIRFRRRETFDSGRTPSVVVQGKRRPPTLADIDIPAIAEAMKATQEEAEANDPAKLRKQIAQLERDLRAAQAQVSRAATERVEVPVEVRVEVPVLSDDDRLLLTAVRQAVSSAGNAMETLDTRLGQITTMDFPTGPPTGVAQRGSEVAGSRRAPASDLAAGPVATLRRPDPATRRGGPTERRERPVGDAPTGLPPFDPSKSERKILDAIAWWEAAGFAAPSRRQVGYVAGYRPGGRYNNLVSGLKTSGLIHFPQDKTLALTDAGRDVADVPLSPPTAVEMQSRVMSILPPSEQKILGALLDAYPDALTREDLMAATGYNPGGRFNNLVSGLKSLGLIYFPDKGHVSAEPFLFMEADR